MAAIEDCYINKKSVGIKKKKNLYYLLLNDMEKIGRKLHNLLEVNLFYGYHEKLNYNNFISSIVFMCL